MSWNFHLFPPHLQISLGPETATRKDQKGKSQMHTTAQEHTLRSLQAPSRQNHEIIDGAQGSLAAVASGCVKSRRGRLCLAMYLVASSCMGWRGGCWTRNCLLDGLKGSPTHSGSECAACFCSDQSSQRLSCWTPVWDCRLHNASAAFGRWHYTEAKQISFSTTESFAYMGI